VKWEPDRTSGGPQVQRDRFPTGSPLLTRETHLDFEALSSLSPAPHLPLASCPSLRSVSTSDRDKNEDKLFILVADLGGRQAPQPQWTMGLGRAAADTSNRVVSEDRGAVQGK
jgi:hypothetical protein